MPVEAGIYRLNQVKNPEDVLVACAKRDESELPQTFVDYDAQPREYFLNAVSTVLDVHTRVSDLYSSPHDQIKEQLRLTIETIKEKQESELINNPDYGLLASVHPDQIVYPLTGAPTPDDLDVVGLYQPGLPGEQSPGLSVRFMGINRNAIASYLISLYCSLAVQTDDALAVLEDVEVGKYHDYPDTYK